MCFNANTDYSEREAFLVWTAEVPFAPSGLHCLDTGGAEVSSEAPNIKLQDLPPSVRFNPSGERVAESDWIDVPQHNKGQVILRDFPTEVGYVAVDDNWEECHYQKLDRSQSIRPSPRKAPAHSLPWIRLAWTQ